MAYPPGSFARSPRDLARNLWDPGRGLYGMFDVWSFRGIEALVSSGLGGGSIYANVLMRKPERWFVHERQGEPGYEHWPVTYAQLEPHYEACEKMLGATPFPFDYSPFSRTPKTRAMQNAAGCLRRDWTLPNLAVTFGNPGRPPAPGSASSRSAPTFTTGRGSPAASAASVTSAATTARRTALTTTTCLGPGTTVPRSARCVRWSDPAQRRRLGGVPGDLHPPRPRA